MCESTITKWCCERQGEIFIQPVPFQMQSYFSSRDRVLCWRVCKPRGRKSKMTCFVLQSFHSSGWRCVGGCPGGCASVCDTARMPRAQEPNRWERALNTREWWKQCCIAIHSMWWVRVCGVPLARRSLSTSTCIDDAWTMRRVCCLTFDMGIDFMGNLRRELPRKSHGIN